MTDQATVPMFAPDGSTGDVPLDKVQAAQQAGFKRAYEMVSPDGGKGYIPEDRVRDAQQANFRLSDVGGNPSGEGTYEMWNTAGQKIAVPYSKVPLVQQEGYKFDTNADKSGMTPDQRFQKDSTTGLQSRGGWNVGDVVRGAVATAKSMIAHPVQTVESMGSPFVATGGSVGGGYGGTLTNIPGSKTGAEAGAQNQQAQQHAEEDQIQQAIFMRRNPAYTAGAILGPAIATAGAAKIAPKVLGGLGRAAGRGALMGETPEGAYETALKPSTVISPEKRAAIVQTGLENEIPISKAGVEKIGDLIDDLNTKIAQEIQSNQNRVISPSRVAKNIDDVRQRFANQVNPKNDLAAIEDSKQQFLDQFRAQPGNQNSPLAKMTGPEAQAMKQGTYRILRGKYGEQGSASTEAQKTLARGLKEEILDHFPEVKNLNAVESNLLDLQPVLERAVNRISNHQPIGIGTPIAGTAVKAATGSSSLAGVGMFMKSILDNPAVKSRLAIAVSKANKIPIGQASAKVQAYAAALGSTAGAAQENYSAESPSQ